MTRRKALLLFTAAALTVSLSAGVVLMLFTDKTAAAMNKLRFSSGIKAALAETVLDDSGGSDVKIVGNDGFYGIDFGAAAPGQTLKKAPKVIRRDPKPRTAASAYVAVKATLALGEGFDDDNKTALLGLLGGFRFKSGDEGGLGDGWIFLRDVTALTGWFFYVEESGVLKELPPGNGDDEDTVSETSAIFTEIAIPGIEGETIETFAKLAGTQVTLKLEPRLTQAEYNPYNETQGESLNDYLAAFTFGEAPA
ncbi:MAG: hypothetical protein LBD49_00770 [Oscillospiraceae bacterium]|jgi:hypothetical protein|nr:hypothetical protein [Oscillospiraceae bacterium]